MMSIIFILLFAACLAGILYYPKTEGRINGIKAVVAGIALLFCGQALVGLVFYLLHISVGLVSVGCVMLLGSVVLWYGIWKKKCTQKLFWRKTDIISALVLGVFVWLVSAHIFGMDLGLQYQSVEAAENFADAMGLVRGQTAEKVGFATVLEALFIQVFAPAFSQAFYFKGYILADISLHLLEVLMFYVVILSFSEKRVVRVWAPILCMAYFWGYPAYNFMAGNYDSWGVRTLLVLLGIYVLRLPVIRNKIRKGTPRKEILSWGIFIAILVAAAFLWSLKGTVETREIYRSMYGDLVFFVPVLLYVCYQTFFRGKTGGLICALSIAMVICTIILYGFWYRGEISNYDYYQNYAILWLLGWLLAVLALDISAENGELPQFFSYAGLVGVLAFLVLSGSAERVAGYDGKYVTKNFFSLYRYNADCILADYGMYRVPESTLELYNEVAEEHKEYPVPILTEDIREQIWYDALTDNDSAAYSLTQYGLPDVLTKLERDNVQAVVVQKDKAEYQEYREYLERCPETATTTAGLYQMPGEDWTDIYGTDIADYDARMELYSYVKEELPGEQIPLMAAKSACIDFILYEDVTGNSSAEFYTWRYHERENVENLNAHGVRYVTLLKEDDYYIGNQMYYGGQEILFENEVGLVVRCVGEEWFLGE